MRRLAGGARYSAWRVGCRTSEEALTGVTCHNLGDARLGTGCVRCGSLRGCARPRRSGTGWPRSRASRRRRFPCTSWGGSQVAMGSVELPRAARGNPSGGRPPPRVCWPRGVCAGHPAAERRTHHLALPAGAARRPRALGAALSELPENCDADGFASGSARKKKTKRTAWRLHAPEKDKVDGLASGSAGKFLNRTALRLEAQGTSEADGFVSASCRQEHDDAGRCTGMQRTRTQAALRRLLLPLEPAQCLI